MRWWRLPLGVFIVLVIVIWDVGLPGRHTPSTSAAGPSASAAPSSGSPSAAASSSPPIPGILQPQGKPEFAATFDGSKLDTSVWDTCYPGYPGYAGLGPGQLGSAGLSQRGCKNLGNNEESEWYLPSQVQVSGGMLHLVAQREPTEGTTSTGAPKQYECRSGMITSYPGMQFKYGYIQIVARIPSDPGLWPALWLNPANLSWPPEMDILESWGDGRTAGSYYHPLPTGYPSDKGPITPALRATGWHTFALSWTSKKMIFLMDGKVTLTVTTKIPHQKMYFIADLASYRPVGPANQCSGQMLIKSVEVWKA